jgi:tetratricopeptide (TPR) repeat protein
MERKKSLVLFFLLILLHLHVHASHRENIYKAYINNDMQAWKNTIDKMNLSSGNASDEFLLELVNYEYGYIGWCIGNKKTAEAKEYLKKAENRLITLEKNQFRLSMIEAYKSAFYGFQIGFNKLKAPVLGPKSVEAAKLAIQYDPNNYFGYLQMGNIYYYSPAAFGGSKAKAIESYRQAEKLILSNNHRLKNDWIYLSLLVTLAQAYENTGNDESAKIYYQKILNVEPDFAWVKNKLYPEFLKKTQKNNI